MKTTLGHTLSQLEWAPVPCPVVNLRGWLYVPSDLQVIETDAAEEQTDGRLWYHVSCSRPDRMPSYDDLLRIKRTFCKGRTALQIFPPEERHISGVGMGTRGHPYCLHLWVCVDEDGAGLPDFGRYGTL